MEENKEKKQQDTAFGARIDKIYEEIFNKELDEYKDSEGNLPRGIKKRLLEKMIYEFRRNKREQEKEDVLSLESEVSLIASDLENILEIFKKIKTKAQNTLIAERTNFEQKIKNYETEIETEVNRNKVLESRNKELEIANETFEEAKITLLSQIDKIKGDKEKIIEELQTQKLENANLLKTNNSLEKISHGNKEIIMELKKKLQNADDEIHSLKNLVKTNEETILSLETRIKNLQQTNDEIRSNREKDIEDIKISFIEKMKVERLSLETRIKDLQQTNEDLRINKEKDIESIKSVLKEKMEVEKETSILDIKREQYEIQKEFNILQLKNIEFKGLINSRDLEISRLNSEVEKYKETIIEITDMDKKKQR